MTNAIEKKKEIDFFESSLWAAITFSRIFNDKITIKEIIFRYKEYFDVDDDYLDEASAFMTYYRVAEKQKKIISKNETSMKISESEKISFALSILNDLKK
jgi:hypothetical protein